MTSGSIIENGEAISMTSALGAIGLANGNGYSQSMPPHKYSVISQDNPMQNAEEPNGHVGHKK